MNPISELVQRTPLILLMAASLSLLTACNNDDNNGDTAGSTGQVIVAGAAADFTSGSVSLVEEESLILSENVLATETTDIAVRSFGDHYYLLEKFGTNALTKFAIDDPANSIWNYSTEGNDEGSNPHDVVFASEEKAYLLRYGTDTAWVINPSASDEASFKTADLDLSAYDPGDGSVEMTKGLILDGKLFVLLQRMTTKPYPEPWLPNEAYVAVIDITDDREIATGAGGDLNGVLLPLKNPNAMIYNEADGLIYIQGTGRYAWWDGSQPAELTGGIATLNPTSYETNLVVDDGDDANTPFGGQITNMAIIDADNGYFISYAGWQNTSLYHFNPSTGDTEAVNNFANVDVRSMAGHNGSLWLGTGVGTSGTATLSVINPADQSVSTEFSLGLNPIGLAFSDE